MASHRITLDTDTISMTAAAADSLITRGQGDPALLYLYLLRHQGYLDPDQSAKELGWSRLQLDSALTHLRELGLAGGVPQPQFNEAVPKREQAPTYSADDLNQELGDQTSAFPDLLSEVEVAMGKRLSPADTKILLELYDHLACRRRSSISWSSGRSKSTRTNTARGASLGCPSSAPPPTAGRNPAWTRWKRQRHI